LLADAFGNAIGNSIVGKLQQSDYEKRLAQQSAISEGLNQATITRAVDLSIDSPNLNNNQDYRNIVNGLQPNEVAVNNRGGVDVDTANVRIAGYEADKANFTPYLATPRNIQGTEVNLVNVTPTRLTPLKPINYQDLSQTEKLAFDAVNNGIAITTSSSDARAAVRIAMGVGENGNIPVNRVMNADFVSNDDLVKIGTISDRKSEVSMFFDPNLTKPGINPNHGGTGLNDHNTSVSNSRATAAANLFGFVLDAGNKIATVGNEVAQGHDKVTDFNLYQDTSGSTFVEVQGSFTNSWTTGVFTTEKLDLAPAIYRLGQPTTVDGQNVIRAKSWWE